MKFTIDVTKRQLLTQRYDYQAIMYLTLRFANIQVSRDFGKFIVEHSSRMMVSDDNQPKPGCTSFQLYYDPSFKLNDNTVVQGFELTFFIIPFDPLGRNYQDLSEEEKETLGKQAGMTRCFFQTNDFQGDDNNCIIAFIPPASIGDSNLSSNTSQSPYQERLPSFQGFDEEKLPSFMRSSFSPSRDRLPSMRRELPGIKYGNPKNLFDIDAGACFNYSAKENQRCFLYFNDHGLTPAHRDTLGHFTNQLLLPVPSQPDEQPMLRLKFNIPEAVDFMMSCSETGNEGVYEAVRKEDFEQLRNDLIAALAKIDAMKFQ